MDGIGAAAAAAGGGGGGAAAATGSGAAAAAALGLAAPAAPTLIFSSCIPDQTIIKYIALRYNYHTALVQSP